MKGSKRTKERNEDDNERRREMKTERKKGRKEKRKGRNGVRRRNTLFQHDVQIEFELTKIR